METQMTFKRYELKYILTKNQYHELKEIMQEYMCLDQFGKHTIRTIYLDTQDHRLIRHSIEKPTYKEKLRVRAYGDIQKEDDVFIELKKKYEGVVYKRRISVPQEQAVNYLENHVPLAQKNQITREIDYFIKYYEGLKPSMLLSYDREAFFGLEDVNFRMTFDQNVLSREDHLSLLEEVYGDELLPEDTVLLEVKTTYGLPSWLLHFFSSHQLYKTSFSKYGTAYKKVLFPKIQGGDLNV